MDTNEPNAANNNRKRRISAIGNLGCPMDFHGFVKTLGSYASKIENRKIAKKEDQKG